MHDLFFGKNNNLNLVRMKNNIKLTDDIDDTELTNEDLINKIKLAIGKICEELKICYSDIYEWIDDNYIDLLTGKQESKRKETILERPFLIYLDKNNDYKVAGICLMKRTETDQRIGLLYVMDGYRNNGIAQDMLMLSHAILNIETTDTYIYINEMIFRKYPFYPHVIVKCGFQYDNSKVESNNFYFTMNKSYSNLLNRYNRSIISQDKDMTFGVIK